MLGTFMTHRTQVLLLPLLAVVSATSSAAAEDPPPASPSSGSEVPTGVASQDAQEGWQGNWQSALDNDYYKISFNSRLRMEIADQDSLETSKAFTWRTRFGVGSKPFHGFSAFIEGEGTFSFDNDEYWDGTKTNNRGQTIVADPESIELNRAFGRYHNPELWNVDTLAGRQRILIDDQRFVGNVGWRQNEQTFDATWASTSLGIEGLRVAYGFLWDINRIYSNKGDEGTEDWDSKSHIAHVSYQKFSWLKASAFAYIFDFRSDSPGNSSDSYGFRFWGDHVFDETWKVAYSGSFAYQEDAKQNPADYDAYYGWLEGSAGHVKWGSVGTGLEVLGSDDGDGRFVTPLATAHKFNGFADAFLDNGGARGLRDYFFWVKPWLPFGFKASVIYHRFWRDDGGGRIGDEWDFVISRSFWDRFTVLSKGAFFDGRNSSGVADRWRYWLQLEFAY